MGISRFSVDLFYFEARFGKGVRIAEDSLHVFQKVPSCIFFVDDAAFDQGFDVAFSDKVKMVEDVDCEEKGNGRSVSCALRSFFVRGCWFLTSVALSIAAARDMRHNSKYGVFQTKALKIELFKSCLKALHGGTRLVAHDFAPCGKNVTKDPFLAYIKKVVKAWAFDLLEGVHLFVTLNIRKKNVFLIWCRTGFFQSFADGRIKKHLVAVISFLGHDFSLHVFLDTAQNPSLWHV